MKGVKVMGMTMTQKVLAAHAGFDKVKAGQLIMANLDLVLGNDNQVRKNLIIYRNGDEFIIKSNDDKITEVELYDSVGRLLITVKPNATEARINVSHLSNAFYVLKIDQNGKVSSKKVIK